MPTKLLWQWRGLSTQGEVQQGTLWAASRTDVLMMLQQRKITLPTIKRSPVRAAHWRTQHSCDVIEQLAALLQAGITLSDGLNLLAQQHPSKQWQALLEHLGHELAHGISLSLALQQWPQAFPPLYQAMIRTGEITGKLDQCCFHLVHQQKAQQQLTLKVKKALRYPIIILSLAVMVVMAMLWFVLPEFAAIYRTFDTPLPTLTLAVMATADFIAHWYWLIAGVLLLPTVLAPLLRHNIRWRLFWAKRLLETPVMGSLARGQKLSQIFTVLSLTQSAGITFLQGLESVEETLTCLWWRGVIQQAHRDIVQGNAIWQALKNTGAFTPLCLQLVRTGEATGALDTMLKNLAQYHSEKTHHQAENLASLLEPALLLVTGIIIGTLVVAMYLPIFHLGDAISGIG